MLFGALVLCLQVASPTVSYETKATSVQHVLADLSTQLSQKLEVHGRLADQILYVNVKNVSADDLKAKIADAMAASWTKKEDREVLVRTKAQEDSIRQDQTQKRNVEFVAEFKRLEAQIDKPFDAKMLAQGLIDLGEEPDASKDESTRRAYYAKQKTLFSSSPLSRLMVRLILACKTEDFAAVSPYGRMLFTANPTQLQRGFAAGKFEAALKQYASEQSAWVDAAKAVDFGDDHRGRMVSDPRTQLDNDPNSTRFKLEFVRGDMTGLGMVNLRSIGGMIPGWRTASQLDLAGSEREYLNGDNASQIPEDSEVEMSDDTKLFNTALAKIYSQEEGIEVPDRVIEFLMNPDKYDPLSFLASDVLNQYTKSAGTNLVASLSDTVYNWLAYSATARSAKFGSLLEALKRTGALTLVAKDGWTIGKSENRFEEELRFTPRVPMAKLMQSIQKLGTVDMNEMAAFAFASQRISRLGLSDLYMMLYDRSAGSALDRMDWDTVRFYGSLGASQRARLNTGGSIPFTECIGEQKALLNRILYKSEILSEEQTSEGTQIHPETAVEPTERYASGLPLNGSVSAKVTNHPVIVTYIKNQSGMVIPTRTIEPWTLAHVEVEAKDNPKMAKNYGVSGLVGYGVGNQKQIALRFMLEPKLWKEQTITVNEFNRAAKPVAWDKLDEKWVKQIRANIEQVKAQKSSQGIKTSTPPL